MKLNYELHEFYNSLCNEISTNTKVKQLLNNIYELRNSKLNIKNDFIEYLNNLSLYLTNEETEELKNYLIKYFYSSSDELITKVKELNNKIIKELEELNITEKTVYYIGATGIKLYKIDTFSKVLESFINILLEKICLKNNKINLSLKNRKNLDDDFYKLINNFIKYLKQNNLMSSNLIEYLSLFQEDTTNKNYLKRPKIKNKVFINDDKEIDYLASYQKLTYQLYKLRMNTNPDLEEISKLEFKLLEISNKYNIGNIEKIEASIYAIEKYHKKLKQEENLTFSKKRGLSIYEDLSYKLYKQKSKSSINVEKTTKLEEKIEECVKKYNLEETEKIDAQIRVIQKYSEKLDKENEDKKIGLNTYEHLISDLHNLKREKLKNTTKIEQLSSQIKKCSNKYNLSNLDKINIQFKVLEQIN